MAQATYTMVIKVRWWVVPYLRTLGFFCMTFGTTPDFGKVGRFIARRGLKVVS